MIHGHCLAGPGSCGHQLDDWDKLRKHGHRLASPGSCGHQVDGWVMLRDRGAVYRGAVWVLRDGWVVWAVLKGSFL
jgi:hypothetical protein